MAICFDKVTPNVHTPTRRRNFIHRSSSTINLRSSLLTSSDLFGAAVAAAGGAATAPVSVVATAI
ncbi:MAG TPA: hypothetical protein VIX17_05490 [Pyrinomonadaceae bacterium]|jgi:hypothetical protein